MVQVDVRAAVDETIRERLSAIRIISVDTVKGEDFDGDDILRVTVVVDSPVSDFDISRVSGLVRHLRSRLDGMCDAFPIVSFRTKSEMAA